jgi:hypothetical protein
MPLAFDLGDNASNQVDIIPLAVTSGQTITLKNVAGSTINVLGNGLNGGATSTIAATASGTFTAPTYVASQGRTSCLVSGGVYGN